MPRILMVHLYGFNDTKNLGPLTLAVLQGVLYRMLLYDQVIILGGWHDENLASRPTSAELAVEWLAERGAPRSKLVTQFSVGGAAAEKMPPRDTIEESYLAGQILRQLYPTICPNTIAFDAIGMWFHQLRISMIWRARGARCKRVLSATSPETGLFGKGMLKRIIQEPPGIFITFFDPYGYGNFFKRLRKGRTHKMQNQEGWIANSAHVWDPLHWS